MKERAEKKLLRKLLPLALASSTLASSFPPESLLSLRSPLSPHPSQQAGLVLKDGKFFKNGEHFYIKAAWPYIATGPNLPGILRPECAALRGTTQETRECMDFGNENFDAIVTYPQRLRQDGFNTLVIGAHWDQYDTVGKGEITDQEAMSNTNRLIEAANQAGMYTIIKFHLSHVDVGAIPENFFKLYPDAYALDKDGNRAYNWPYSAVFKGHPIPPKINKSAFMPVPSIHHPAYQQNSRKFIREFLNKVDRRNLAFITEDIEPQYFPETMLDFSNHARNEYIKDGGNWPPTQAEIDDSQSYWNTWRARKLAQRSYQNALTVKETVGYTISVSVINLVIDKNVLIKGNSQEFLHELIRLDTGTQPVIDIIEANWHEMGAENLVRANGEIPAYQQIREANTRRKVPWGATAYITWAATDFDLAPHDYAGKILEHDLNEGTKLAMMVFNTRPNTKDAQVNFKPEPGDTYPNSFTFYDDNWQPKRSGIVTFDAVTNTNRLEAPMSRWVKEATGDTTPPAISEITTTNTISNSGKISLNITVSDNSETGNVEVYALSGGQKLFMARKMTSAIDGKVTITFEPVGLNGIHKFVAEPFDAAGNVCRYEEGKDNCGRNTIEVDTGNMQWKRIYLPLLGKGDSK